MRQQDTSSANIVLDYALNDKNTEKNKFVYEPFNNNIEIKSPTKKDLSEYLNKPNTTQLEQNGGATPLRSDSLKPTPAMPYQKKQVMDKNGYVHQPSYRNNNDLEAYDYDENEDLGALMQNLNDKKNK